MSEEQPSSHPTPLVPNPIRETPCLTPLVKQKSWSPNTFKEEAWLKKKDKSKASQRKSKSVTDEDLDELKACMELGFNFDSSDMDQRLSDTLPAYEFYYNVNKRYCDAVAKPCSGSLPAEDCSGIATASDSTMGSPLNMFSPGKDSILSIVLLPTVFVSLRALIMNYGDDPKRVKTRLRQWAQVVACSVKQSWGG